MNKKKVTNPHPKTWKRMQMHYAQRIMVTLTFRVQVTHINLPTPDKMLLAQS